MSSTYTAATTGLGLTAGTWAIDPVHSEVTFSVRHMMVGKVRGRFTSFEGEVVVTEDGTANVRAGIDVNSVDTQNAQRDDHIRSGDFFDSANHPQITYRSSRLVDRAGHLYVEGELSLHGVTRPVELELEFGGVTRDPYGLLRAGFSATAEITRQDFGVTIQMPMDGGGVVIGDKVKINLEVEAVLQQQQA